jgi:hypothetical protein
VPATSTPWAANPADPASLVPPLAALTDPLPSGLLFGLGIALVVAPLTSTLMGSIPVRNAGLGSAINNALSRIGSPIVVPLLFVVVNGTFYAALASAVGTDPSSASLRASFSPLNPPAPGADSALVSASKLASTDAFHLAVIVCAVLLVAGAVVNLLGLRERDGAPKAGAATAEGGPAASS